ncbi:MAG: hypothetical protein EOP53_06370 [Sphingobacteriales bacterium]|nr:MAG: hypothetical protein EOP53_06370 [Sphingobacteriales bacterium]
MFAVPVITFLTDLGNKDYYVPLMKGQILAAQPNANIIDISHAVEPFHIAEAAFILKGCYKAFPQGTVHIITVDSEQELQPACIMVRAAAQYFICHDNGFISLVLDETEIEEVINLPFFAEDLVFPGSRIFIPAALAVLEGKKMQTLGTPANFLRKGNLLPVIEESIIRASVVYIDNFGNAVTNLHQSDFERYGAGRKFRIYISRQEYFQEICKYYGEVPEGEKVCLFASDGFLEIAINKGNGSGLLGIKIGKTVLVEFL